MTPRSLLWLPTLALALQACAAAAPPAVPGRAVLHLSAAEPAAEPQALQQRVGQVAGVPVVALTLMSPGQWLITLQCPADTGCAPAWQRLAAQTGWVRAVEPDAPAARPRPPERRLAQ